LLTSCPLWGTTPGAYHWLVQLGTLRGAADREPVPQQLLRRRLRLPAAVLLASCVAVTAVLAALLIGRGKPGSLDSMVDPRIQAGLGRFPALLNWLPDLGTLRPVALMTLVLVVACLATRRWSGAILAAAAAPFATALTEYVLKPYVGGPLDAAFPSGHATSMFALAATCAVLLVNPPRRRVPLAARLLLVLMALALATAVAAAMVATGAHAFTDAVAGAAVGCGVVLAGTLILDLVVCPAAASIVRRRG
jgi:membrane-associated phospholipid phosphatase